MKANTTANPAFNCHITHRRDKNTKWMGILATVMLAGCAAPLPVAEPQMAGQFENACLPEAIILRAELKEADIDSRILLIHASNWSHAALVYVYPKEDPKLWVWDSISKSSRIEASYDNPVQIARAWLDSQYKDDFILKAEFL